MTGAKFATLLKRHVTDSGTSLADDDTIAREFDAAVAALTAERDASNSEAYHAKNDADAQLRFEGVVAERDAALSKLDEFKKAVAEKLRFDMASVVDGTPEQQMRAALDAAVQRAERAESERQDEFDRFQNVLVNIHAMVRGRDCAASASIGCATSAVRELLNNAAAFKTELADAIARAERAEADAAAMRATRLGAHCNCGTVDEQHITGLHPDCEYHNHCCPNCHEKRLCTREACGFATAGRALLDEMAKLRADVAAKDAEIERLKASLHTESLRLEQECKLSTNNINAMLQARAALGRAHATLREARELDVKHGYCSWEDADLACKTCKVHKAIDAVLADPTSQAAGEYVRALEAACEAGAEAVEEFYVNYDHVAVKMLALKDRLAAVEALRAKGTTS